MQRAVHVEVFQHAVSCPAELPVLLPLGDYRWPSLRVSANPKTTIEYVVRRVNVDRQERRVVVACSPLQELRK